MRQRGGVRNTIIADSGYWLALANRRDRLHQIAVQKTQQNKAILVTTWPVVTETCHLLLRRIGTKAQTLFMVSYAQGAFDVRILDKLDTLRIPDLMEQYDNLPMDLADASLILLADQLGHGRIFSTDQRDFASYRWKNHHPFENLLLD